MELLKLFEVQKICGLEKAERKEEKATQEKNEEGEKMCDVVNSNSNSKYVTNGSKNYSRGNLPKKI